MNQPISPTPGLPSSSFTCIGSISHQKNKEILCSLKYTVLIVGAGSVVVCCCCGRGCGICFEHIRCCFPPILLAILGLVLLRFWCHIHSVNVDYGGGRSSVPLAGVTAMQSDWQQVSYHAPLQCAHQQQSLVALKQQDSACHLSARSPKWSHEQKSP